MNKQVDAEKIIFDIVAKGKSRSQHGDISDALYAGGAISKDQFDSLKKRDPQWTGNPIDIRREFERQNPK
jgi:hypothetical protein